MAAGASLEGLDLIDNLRNGMDGRKDVHVAVLPGRHAAVCPTRKTRGNAQGSDCTPICSEPALTQAHDATPTLHFRADIAHLGTYCRKFGVVLK